MQQLLQEREAERDRDAIQNEMYLNKQKALTDAEHYRYTLAKHLNLRDNLILKQLSGQNSTGLDMHKDVYIGLQQRQWALPYATSKMSSSMRGEAS